MRRTIAALLIVAAIGCEGANEVVAPQRPTPTPTSIPIPIPTPPATYWIGGTVTRNGQAYRGATVTATSAGQQWTTQSAFNGLYSFVQLPAGEYEVSTSARYCGTKRGTVTIPPNADVDFAFVMCWRGSDGTKGSEE